MQCEDFQALQDIEHAAFGAQGYCNYFLKMIPHLFPTSCLLAEVNGQVAGYSLGAVDGHDPTRTWILTAAVKREFQNRGLGRELTCRIFPTMIYPRTSAAPANKSVYGSRCLIRKATAFPVIMEVPKSPRSRFLAQKRYWTWGGLSKHHLAVNF